MAYVKIEDELWLGGVGLFLIAATVGFSIWLAAKLVLWVAA